ncbi:UDP-glucuronosyltransferase 1-10-like [Contarinia nasturtii]|uniref:UDP-glucuronosyltransferase 1-10-like n=1 Tax=Contarinia nasturtii TaxID=265458 RepID=UPI0012D40C51|nr:UDP-glucuronosyltransferase 1-10-like [Contarinia nasturtii]
MDFRYILLLFTSLTFSDAYKVLFIGIFNGKSHSMFLQSFVKSLLNRGHEVTFLTSQSFMKHTNSTNYSEVLIDPPFDLKSSWTQDKLTDMTDLSLFKSILITLSMTKVMNEYAFENPNVQKLIHSSDLNFDVVINEQFFADSFLMFAHKFNAPIITICPFGITDHIDQHMGLITPISNVPHWILPYTDNMSFIERWHNAVASIFDFIMYRFVYLPTEENLAKKYFAHLGPLPSLNDLLNSISVVFVNRHRALSPPRPAMPGTISIGGAHIKDANPLPNELQTFLDESTDGVIYFSLGTIIESSKLPKEKIQAFLDSFRHLKQRVLWKFEDETLENVPSNVMIKKWMPQNDILAHPNVILFISHGGLFGTSESLYHGVPLLLIPFFGDQHRNAHRIQTAGYGKFILFAEVTKELVSKKIDELISDKTFLNRAKQTSAIFKDNLAHPMDEAMFWIEHVCKFKGAKHLKSHAVNMSWFTYLILDVILANLIIALVIILVLYKLAKKLLSKNKTKEESRKKHN